MISLSHSGTKVYTKTNRQRRVIPICLCSDDPFDFSGRHCFVRCGYSTFVERLAEGVDVRLQHVVEKVIVSSKGVEVITTKGNVFPAAKVVIAVPLGVLQQGYPFSIIFIMIYIRQLIQVSSSICFEIFSLDLGSFEIMFAVIRIIVQQYQRDCIIAASSSSVLIFLVPSWMRSPDLAWVSSTKSY